MIKEKKMFEDAQIGDRVWEFIQGWGTISDNDFSDKTDIPISVMFDNGYVWSYTYEGKVHPEDSNPILFWNEIKFKVPEKPFDLESELKKLEITKFKDNKSNFNLFWNCCCNEISYSICHTIQIPFVIYFTEKSIKNFMNNIKDKKISKEKFFKAYKKVFGGKTIC